LIEVAALCTFRGIEMEHTRQFYLHCLWRQQALFPECRQFATQRNAFAEGDIESFMEINQLEIKDILQTDSMPMPQLRITQTTVPDDLLNCATLEVSGELWNVSLESDGVYNVRLCGKANLKETEIAICTSQTLSLEIE
jgi:hypothetical protein